MTTLADLTRQTSRLVNRHASGSATSSPGNATTLPDTVGLAGYPNDQFNGGTIWITSGANIGLSRSITDFADTGDTLTFAAFPANIVSGVTYECCDSNFVKYQDLRQAVNLALREIGMIEDADETTSAVEDDTIYALPAGVYRVTRIEVVTDIGTVSEESQVNNHWEERDGYLYFDEGYEPAADDSQIIRILYEKFHAELVDDDDTLSTQVSEEYLVYLAARQAMRLAYKRHGKAGSETIPEWLNEAADAAMRHIKPNQPRRIMFRTAANR